MLVSGQWFEQTCRWNLDNRYPLRIWNSPSEVTEGDRVFLKQDDLPQFKEMVKDPTHPRVDLVIHNTDRRFTEHVFTQIKDKVRNMYAINAVCPSATKIPLGLRDHQYTTHDDIYEILKEPQKDRTIFCLVNFMISNNPELRKPIFEHFRNQAFCTVQDYVSFHRGTSLNFSNPETIQRRKDFYRTLKCTKFAICPFGAGMDTHRVYECIVFGVIPIVQSSPLNKLYRHLPVFIVDQWSDVTEERLKACTIRPNPNKVLKYKAPWD